jgi:hypothetical protein
MQLGWEKNVDPDNPKQFTFPGEPLAHFCKEMQSKLKDRTMRVVGDPRMPVKRVLVSWGFVSRMPGISLFARPDVDVFIAGETREWELVEYVRDSITAGNKKALILPGPCGLGARRQSKNISKKGPRNCRSLGCARDDKGKGDASIESGCWTEGVFHLLGWAAGP